MITNKQYTCIVMIIPGEHASIGPDLSIMLAQKQWLIELIFCADLTLLINKAKELHCSIQICPYQKNTYISLNFPKTLKMLPITTEESIIPRKLNVNNTKYIIKTLQRACDDGCINGELLALVTGPVHKGMINDSEIKFSGHTEFFAKYSKSKKVVMMLTDHKLRIALMTTHILIPKNNKIYHKTIIIQNNSYTYTKFKKIFLYSKT